MGDTSFEQLVTARSHALLRLAVMLTGNQQDAEDLLQSTLARVHRHAERVTAMAAPAAYLRSALVNEHLSKLRYLKRRLRTTSTDQYQDPADDRAARDLSQIEGHDEVWQLLATLPRKQRAVLVLRFYEDVPDSEIAALLECTEATVRSNASRGLAALRARMGTTTKSPQEVRP